jgi:hypothetical protein
MVFVTITQESIQNWYLNKADQGIKRTLNIVSGSSVSNVS